MHVHTLRIIKNGIETLLALGHWRLAGGWLLVKERLVGFQVRRYQLLNLATLFGFEDVRFLL